jgi:hypothetical protein
MQKACGTIKLNNQEPILPDPETKAMQETS